MEDFTISIDERKSSGKSDSKRARREGLVPAIVYEAGQKGITSTVNAKEFTNMARRATTAQIFTFKSANSALNGRLAIVKEIQKNYLKGDLLHIDFQAIREDQKISVRVPLRFKGEATGVKNEGGVLSVASHNLGITCLPRKIPGFIEVDVAPLGLNDSIHASDLKLPEGVSLSGSPEETIVSVVLVRTMVEETPAAATAVAADGTAAPAAEGAAAAPAAGADGAAPAAGAKAAEAAPAKGGDKAKK